MQIAVINERIETTNDMEEKKINQMSLANCDLDEVEIVLGDRFELKIEDDKYYAVRKKPTYTDENLFHTTNEYEEIVENSFQGGYEKCKSDIKLNGYDLPDGYHFTDENGNVIDARKILLVKNAPSYAVGLMDDKVNGDEEHKIDATIDYAEIDKQCFDEVHKRYSEITHVCLTGHGYTLPDGFHLVDENGKSIDASKIKLVKNAPNYPRTYDDCLDVLSMEYAEHYNLRYFTYERGFYEYATTDKLCSLQDKLNILGKLIICRNAYWKIAGEQMGLDKPWEPDFDNLSTTHEFIKIDKGCFYYSSKLLVFPTIEMRDAFYNNFKFLIELCKELL